MLNEDAPRGGVLVHAYVAEGDLHLPPIASEVVVAPQDSILLRRLRRGVVWVFLLLVGAVHADDLSAEPAHYLAALQVLAATVAFRVFCYVVAHDC